MNLSCINNQKKNLNIFFIYSLVSSFILTRGIFLLYLAHKGLTITEVAMYQSVFSISTTIFEIPTGYFADRFGKKNSLILGMILLAVHSAFMILGKKTIILISLGLLEAVAYTFVSGCDSALLYELLEKLENKSEYLKINSILLSIQSIITGIALSVGAFLAKYSWRLPYIFTIIIFIFSAITLNFIDEDKEIYHNIETKLNVKHNTYKIIKRNITYNIPSLFALFFIASSVCDGFFMSYYNLNQLILQNYGIDLKIIGLFFSASYFINSIAYLSVNFLNKFFNRKQIFIGILFVECGLFFILFFMKMKLAILVISIAICFFPEVLYVICDSIIQQYIRSDYRSTILSIVSLLRSAMSSIIYLILGYSFEIIDMKYSILGISIMLGVSCISTLVILKRTKRCLQI